MSRIGKLPVQIPSGVQVTVDDKNHTIVVKGKLGELRQKVNPDIKVVVEDNQLKVSRPSDDKAHRSLHGLYQQSFPLPMIRSLQQSSLKCISRRQSRVLCQLHRKQNSILTKPTHGLYNYKIQRTAQCLEVS